MANNNFSRCRQLSDGQRGVLGLITARGGSQRLPRKNILPFCGKPLIAWTIEAALASECITDCIVSSENEEILEIAREYGALTPFVRPAELSSDASASIDVILHALEWLSRNRLNYKSVILLQPTSPLRLAEDIDNAFTLYHKVQAVSCVSVCEIAYTGLFYHADAQLKLKPFISSEMQEFKNTIQPIYYLNGAIYISDAIYLRKYKSLITDETIGYIMPKERAVDIDSALDFSIAEFLFKRYKYRELQSNL
jgi:CMP-N-acetylneuraminic acid synthetase